ncbi:MULTISPECIES: site-2 protease family protein [unclassified Streptococcus]|uniref:site-2 protease family protein n=1 Tax=unclassified Streptococcus TaxID=2608887 RepID=UPI001072DB91|nr:MULTISPECIES: site-2 protease family protein [unclassified Streptococcus]MBF0805764.1 hypothetical protein [Streptococcus sp. 19428wA2_WM07]TFU28673.1 hypothetical protein E4T71_02925 [Streptococcus sp. WM07]
MKKKFYKFMVWVLILGVGFWLGYQLGAMIAHLPAYSLFEAGFVNFFFIYLLLFLLFIVVIFIHELGHYIGGRLSGYRLISFRVGSWILVRWDEGLFWKRYTLHGTLGQCLMVPPGSDYNQVPVLLYNLGGPLINILFAPLIFLGLKMAPSWWSFSLFLFGGLNLLFFLINGIPLKGKIISNDGMNAWELYRSSVAREAFVKQLMVTEGLTRGRRFKDLPEELFYLKSLVEEETSFVSMMNYYWASYLLDKGVYREGREVLNKLVLRQETLPGLLKIFSRLSLLSLELFENPSEVDLSILEEKETKQVLKAMKDYPSILSIQYGIARLCNQDQAEADAIRKRLEKVLQTYPIKAEIEMVLEDVDMVDRIAAGEDVANLFS